MEIENPSSAVQKAVFITNLITMSLQ